MGFFNKIKSMFQGTDKKADVKVENKNDNVELSTETVEKDEVKKSVKIYEKGLTKSRDGFVSKLAGLTNKYKKVTESFLLLFLDLYLSLNLDLQIKYKDMLLFYLQNNFFLQFDIEECLLAFQDFHFRSEVL